MIKTITSQLYLNDQHDVRVDRLDVQSKKVSNENIAREAHRAERPGNIPESKIGMQETRREIVVAENDFIVQKYNSNGELIGVIPRGYVDIKDKD